uniref:Protein kinase domain-containing protein n=1 Tax=Vitrella brassicaformis TaxID=1169539 RepID=A0A7S1K9Z6_9ALVE|mmetsp:Transcript_44170/g.110079  ORF Transcript_44170/g.110079 Transcript_44170/m.110079 type:complete len:121 (+) Transcript_44170:23-385(+)
MPPNGGSAEGANGLRELTPQQLHRLSIAMDCLSRDHGLSLDRGEKQRLGGFGVVLPMTDREGRKWAVKVLHEQHDCAKMVGGFQRTGNDVWMELCRQWTPGENIVKIEDVYHLTGPTRNG